MPRKKKTAADGAPGASEKVTSLKYPATRKNIPAAVETVRQRQTHGWSNGVFKTRA